MNGAKSATNSAAGEISTAVRPDGTSCSPKVIRLNGRATADEAEQRPPSRAAGACRRARRGRRRAGRPHSTTAAIAVRAQTIIGALKSSSAYLISR